jgi:2-hydroxy-3-oxopropionate reductase
VPANANLAFLGLGQMGAPIARLLLAHGHNVTLWNRDRSKAEAIQSGNARIATSPQDAARGAEIVFTMLTDDSATEAVLFGSPDSGRTRQGFLDTI